MSPLLDALTMATNRLPLPESIKDMGYRYLGLFPPKPPSNPPLGSLTPEIRQKIENLNTVCLFLGPNRNLTTLMASVLALHPNCQVMSHGGPRVLPAENLNFLKEYSYEKFLNFCHFVLVMSQTRDKGSFGGGITITHAFRYHKLMRNTYRRRYGRSMLKPEVKSLVWKEAHRTDDFIVENDIDIPALLNQNAKLRFMMPIRNPLHVAYSFFTRKGFRQNFFDDQVENPDIYALLDSLLIKLARTIKLHLANPDRVLIFFEDDIHADLFRKIAVFLQIEPEERWIKDALRCFDVTTTQYEISQPVVRFLKKRISELFVESPQILRKFEQYI